MTTTHHATEPAPAGAPVGSGRRPRRSRPGSARRWGASTVAGLATVGVLFALGLAAPLLAGHPPQAQGPDALAPISADHPLGTDEFGRDLFSRVLYGIRVDVWITLVAVPIGALVGTALGLACGVHRFVDLVLQRIFDVTLAFTALVLGVTVAAIVQPGTTAVIWTVALVNVPLFGRITRDAVMAQRDRDYVTAAKVTGVGPVRLLTRHILPNCVDPLIVQAALSLSTAVFIEGAMSFVGLGVRPPEPSLGSLLRTSINFLDANPAYAIGPMVAVTALVVGFNLIADGLNKGLLRR
ncbi:ABC transporter permease [Longispora sp. K20-0274]|uniref:ABC transporter permease n=1 Tax=Longispora sp. K20-0274 TaxID=3088255 RepID=UPI00399A6165